MGQFSHKGPPLTPVALPCGECVSKPCCRQGNGVDVHHTWPFATRVDGVPLPYSAAGCCPNFDGGKCAIQATKPKPCLAFDCREPWFRAHHAAVDALLTRHGL